jgi:hypothetical protein
LNLPTVNLRRTLTGSGLDEHVEQSRLAQRQADKWLISGSLYDIFYITPFLAIPYLHTVNREIFSD